MEEGLEEVPWAVGGSEQGRALPSPPAASVTFKMPVRPAVPGSQPSVAPQGPQERALVLPGPLSAFLTWPRPTGQALPIFEPALLSSRNLI